MVFAAVALATFWAWDFIHHYARWIPDYISYFLVPAIAYGIYQAPHQYIYPPATAAVVGLLHRLTQLPVKPAPTPVPRRRTNIPDL